MAIPNATSQVVFVQITEEFPHILWEPRFHASLPRNDAIMTQKHLMTFIGPRNSRCNGRQLSQFYYQSLVPILALSRDHAVNPL